jgi:hypothetical protein
VRAGARRTRPANDSEWRVRTGFRRPARAAYDDPAAARTAPRLPSMPGKCTAQVLGVKETPLR